MILPFEGTNNNCSVVWCYNYIVIIILTHVQPHVVCLASERDNRQNTYVYKRHTSESDRYCHYDCFIQVIIIYTMDTIIIMTVSHIP